MEAIHPLEVGPCAVALAAILDSGPQEGTGGVRREALASRPLLTERSDRRSRLTFSGGPPELPIHSLAAGPRAISSEGPEAVPMAGAVVARLHWESEGPGG